MVTASSRRATVELRLIWERFEPRTEEERIYFQIVTLDLQRIEEMHRKDPVNIRSCDEAIQAWLLQLAERGSPE